MGLFSFLKKAGAKVLTKKAAQAVSTPETRKLEEELFKKQKLILLKGVIDSMGIKVKNLELDLNKGKVTIYGSVKKQEEKERVILALGNVGGISKVDDRISVSKPAPEAKFYTVKKGDSLSKIAKRFYGDPMKYKQLFEANQPPLKNPNKIFPGQQLRIPNLK